MHDRVQLPKWASSKLLRKLLTKKVVHVTRVAGGKVQTTDWGERKIRFWANLILFFPVTFTVLICAIGLSLSAFFCFWPDLFSRLGAVVASVGIVFALTTHAEAKKKLDTQVYASLLNGAQDIAIATSRQAGAGYIQKPTNSFSLQRDIKRMVEAASKEQRPFQVFESCLVVFGSLQWAFGDLLVRKILSGENQCFS